MVCEGRVREAGGCKGGGWGGCGWRCAGGGAGHACGAGTWCWLSESERGPPFKRASEKWCAVWCVRVDPSTQPLLPTPLSTASRHERRRRCASSYLHAWWSAWVVCALERSAPALARGVPPLECACVWLSSMSPIAAPHGCPPWWARPMRVPFRKCHSASPCHTAPARKLTHHQDLLGLVRLALDHDGRAPGPAGLRACRTLTIRTIAIRIRAPIGSKDRGLRSHEARGEATSA